MLYFALCPSYHSNTEAVLFACLSLGWQPQRVDCLDTHPKVGNSIKCLSHKHNKGLPHRESNQGYATFRLLVRRSTNWATPPPDQHYWLISFSAIALLWLNNKSYVFTTIAIICCQICFCLKLQYL